MIRVCMHLLRSAGLRRGHRRPWTIRGFLGKTSQGKEHLWSSGKAEPEDVLRDDDLEISPYPWICLHGGIPLRHWPWNLAHQRFPLKTSQGEEPLWACHDYDV